MSSLFLSKVFLGIKRHHRIASGKISPSSITQLILCIIKYICFKNKNLCSTEEGEKTQKLRKREEKKNKVVLTQSTEKVTLAPLPGMRGPRGMPPCPNHYRVAPLP